MVEKTADGALVPSPRNPLSKLRTAAPLMAEAPPQFDAGKRYLVQLKRAVPVIPGDPSNMLRPSDLVEVTGAFANTIADAILYAKAL